MSSSKSHRNRESAKERTSLKVRKSLEKHKLRRIKRKDRKITLEYEKFVEHVEKRHHYYVVSVIVDAKTELVKFIECRTPVRQKTFFVYINPKYVMKAPNEKHIRMRITYLKDEDPSKRNKEFIESIRGRTVRCDMLVIASDMVYFVTETVENQSPDIRCFTVGDDEDDEPEEKEVNKFKKITDSIKQIANSIGVDRPSSKPKVVDIEEFSEEDEDEEGDIEILERDGEPYDPVKSAIKTNVGDVMVSKDQNTGKIVETIVAPSKPPEVTGELPKKPKAQSQVQPPLQTQPDVTPQPVVPPVAPQAQPVEIKNEEEDIEDLEGEDDLIEAFEAPKITPQQPQPQAPLPTTAPVQLPQTPQLPIPKKSSDFSSDEDDESSESSDESEIDEDNEVPDIEEEGIVLGMAYIVIDIHMFFLKIEVYENELADYYVELEENELSVRKGKVEHITELADTIRDKVTGWFERQTAKESSIKADIASLSVAILQITSIKQRIEQNPTKYRSDIIQEITKLDELYASSRDMVREQTVKLLKVRDLIENVLYESTEILEKSASSFKDYLSSDDDE